MIRRHVLVAILAFALGLALALALAGCQPEGYTHHKEDTNELVFIADSDPHTEVDIAVDAFDSMTNPLTNPKTGLPFPWDGPRQRTPYRHPIWFAKGETITASMTVGLLGNEDDTIACAATFNGRMLPTVARFAKVPSNTLTGRAYVEVSCIAVVIGE